MPVRIVTGPSGPKAILVAENGAPLADCPADSDVRAALADTLAVAVADAAKGPELGKPRPDHLPRTVWSPRRPYIHGQLLRLDDSGFSVLGNALLAAWFSGLQRPRPPGRNVDRQEASERAELRDLLDYEGVLDDAFTGPFRLAGDYTPERIGDVARRLESALNSPELFAMLSIRDIDLSTIRQVPVILAAELEAASPAELRSPISRLGPCPVTRELRLLVLGYFRNDRTAPLKLDPPAVEHGGPRSGSERAKEDRAVKVLRSIYLDDPDARMTKAEACDLLSPHSFSKNAKDRVWDAVEAPNWKVAGRPPNRAKRVETKSVAERLAAAL